MYVYKRQVALYQGIATLVTLALVLWGLGTHMFTQTVEAGNLTSVSDTLTDSEPGGTPVHTIGMTIPNGMNIGMTFEVTFPAGFDLTGLNISDISMTVDGNATTTGAAAGAGTWGVATSGQTITFETPTDYGVASSGVLVLTIGSTTNTTILNPSATGTQQISIGGGGSTMQDNGYARVVILENVLVTATINTTFTFFVSGTTTGAICNGADPTFADSTSDALAFGVLDAGVSKTLCQDLTVSTNAINGYVVTVEQDTQFQSSTGADIDGFVDGNWTTTPTAWAAPTASVIDEDTWGHWGLTSSDGTTTRAAEFGSAEYVAASTTPIVIMSHDDPADGTTPGVGRASIGYEVEISALQEAGDDYNTTLTYIATPTF